jgi:hypothetical protein
MQKIEFGIKLPADVQNEIDLFTIQGPDKRADRAYSAANPNHLGINPYNPEELSFECDITMLCSPTATSAVTKNLVFEGLVSFAGNNYRKFSGRIFGFYYMDAVANSSNSNWQISPAEYPVRFRFAAPCEGYYFFKFRIIRNQGKPNESISEIGGIYQGQPGLNLYPVYCTESGAHAARSRGYIEVGSDKRHFRYSRSKTTYIPTGVNFPELHLFGPTPGNQDLTNEYVYGPKGYERRRNEWMHHLANNSGNCYRIVSMEDNDCVELVTATDPGEPPPFPSTCVPFSINPPGSSTQTADCCEPNANMRWNHLNNYSRTQGHMKEMDADFEEAENLGLYVMFCLQMHAAFNENFLMDAQVRWKYNPYSYELEPYISEPQRPASFLSDNISKKFYKYRLRYIQARWGYSPAIFSWQLFSEINTICGRKNIANENFPCPMLYPNDPYDLSAETRTKVSNWTKDMSDYMANMYPRHLITSSYANGNFYFKSAFQEDVSFEHENIDFVCLNEYNDGDVQLSNGVIEKEADEFFRDLATKTYRVAYDPSNTKNTDWSYGYYIDKPFFLSETGQGLLDDQEITLDEHRYLIWSAMMSGMAGPPLQWQNHQYVMPNFRSFSSFFNSIDFENNQYRPIIRYRNKCVIEQRNEPSVDNEAIRDQWFLIGNPDYSGLLDDDNPGGNDIEFFGLQNQLDGASGYSSDAFIGLMRYRFGKIGFFRNAANQYFYGNVVPPDESSWSFSELPVFTNQPSCGTVDIDYSHGEKYLPIYDLKEGSYFFEYHSTDGNVSNLSWSSEGSGNNRPESSPMPFRPCNLMRICLPSLPLVVESGSNHKPQIYAVKAWHHSINGNNLRLQDADSSGSDILYENREKETEKEHRMIVYPNPFQSGFLITSDYPLAQFGIYQPDGKIILQGSIQQGNSSISFSEFSPGFYILRVSEAESQLFKEFKLIKQ